MIVFDKVAVLGYMKKAQQIAETVASTGIETLLYATRKENLEKALQPPRI